MKILRILVPFSFLLIISFQSCKLNKKKEWDVKLLAPIATTELTINDLLSTKDSGVVKNADNSIQVVYNKSLAGVNLGNYIKVPDTSLRKSVNFKTINLGERTLKKSITLGEVARNAGFTGQILILNNGNKMVVPALTNISTGKTSIDAQNFFQTATFIDGKLKLDIYNGFPVDITNIHIQLLNAVGGQIIIDDYISIIPSHTSFSKIYSLAGKTVEGKLIANVISMDSPGSNGNAVLIDTANAMSITISAFDMQVQSAEAIFPAQNLVNDKIDISYNLGGPLITYMRIKSGDIRITAKHTIQDSLHINYSIPRATINGVPLVLNRTVPPAPIGDSAEISEIYKVDNYTIDLSGRNRDTFNTFYNTLAVSIDSSGKIRHLSLKDSIYIFYGLFDVIPEYLHGYLGQRVDSIKASINFDGFNKITGGSLSLPDFKVSLELDNGVGAEANVIITKLTGRNTRTGKTIDLQGTSVGTPIKIKPARDNPFTPSVNIISLDTKNSNIRELLSILPDKIDYDMRVIINPNGNTSNYNDFLYNTSAISASINLETPVQLGINGLTLQDTVAVPLTVSTGENAKDALFNIYVDNGFPFEAQLQLYNMDKFNFLVDSFLLPNNKTIKAGVLDPVTGKIAQSSQSIIQADINSLRVNQLRYSGRMLVKAKLNTVPANKLIKIYSDYKMKVKVTGTLTYHNSL